MRIFQALLCASLLALSASAAMAQQTGPRTATPAEQKLIQAGEEGKFTFLLFHRSSDASTRAMKKAIEQGLEARPGQAVVIEVDVEDSEEAALVNRWGFARAPMPLAASIGPNGALTGVFPRDITPQNIADAFVPPTMLECMKNLQQGKLVFVCVHSTPTAQVPPGVQQFQANPEFAQRTSLVTVSASDVKEARLIQQVQLNNRPVNGTTAALIAPPGVLVGQFNSANSWQQIATALHKAGQCCDDPNCKHNH
jgi:hypothetical protein